ncbi:MAG: DUF3592 domain-containing protein [Candidatus Delongbacteria bacterium]|jgi:hypothetical protein|nr:DUF3592 domain-containing protein [Candidatus Delongbacteria bacterium]
MELARESITWPDVEGKITSSKVISETSRDSKKRNSTTYSAHIEYSYIITDKLHTGNRISFGDYGSSDRGHASSIVRTYPVGKKVKVYYRPKDHGTAVLETGIKGAHG